MSNIRIPRGWEIPESQVTPRGIWMRRRELLKALGYGGSALALGAGCGLEVEGSVPTIVDGDASNPYASFFPYARDESYQVNDRPLTTFEQATTYNNYYEFTVDKDGVKDLVGGFELEPWTIEVTGECNRPRTFGIEDIFAEFGDVTEERIYRHRCVERWSMVVPWTGFPLSALLNAVEPTSNARFVRMVSVDRPSQMPGVDARPQYPWPYHEGLRMDEAMNELTMIVTGLYGTALPTQNGAPIRLVVPWKYGYKSIKAIVRIELTSEQPATFWNTIAAEEYPFLSNVDPDVPHPRWSQEFETPLGADERIRTLLYNGYAEQVAGLYG